MENDPLKNHTEIHAAIGKAIMGWSFVEQDLSILFKFILKTDPALAFAVWDSVISFEAKLKALNAIFLISVKDENLLKIWAKLSDSITKASKKRNKIAHGGVMGVKYNEFVLIPYLSIGAFDYAKNKKFIGQLNLDDLSEIQQEFFAISKACRWILFKINPDYEDGEEFGLTTPDLINHIQSLISQIPSKKKPEKK